MLVWSARGRRAAALLVGLAFGLLFVALTAWFYTQAAREGALRSAFLQDLELPADAFRLESVRAGDLRVSARNVVLLDRAGDTIVAAPRVRFSFASDALAGEGAIVISDVELLDAYLRLVERPSGEWNVQEAVRVTVDGHELTTPDEGRPILLSNVRITRGRLLLATLWEPESTAGAPDLRLARLDGRLYRVRTARDVDARMPQVRVDGAAGWRVQIAAASALLSDPELRLAQLEGVVEAIADGFRFDIATLRTDASLLAGEGRVRSVGERTLVDAELSARPVDFGDLRWVSDVVPAQGQASGLMAISSRADGRTVLAMRDLEVDALDSRAAGRLMVAFGADQPIAFRDTDLQLEPLDLRVLEALGLEEAVPYVGQVRGRVVTLGPVEAAEGPLRLDLVANVAPRNLPLVPVSTLAVEGELALAAEDWILLRGVQLAFRPLHLAALRPLLPEQEAWLRGMASGVVTLSGSTTDLRLSDGDLTYEVGDAAPTRLTGLTGRVTREPELRYDLSAAAQPLALSTVAEFVPAFPFQRTPLSGPVEVVGTAEQLRFSVNLSGDVGGFIASGEVAFGEPLAIDVTGRLDALQPARLMRQDLPMAGPVSGPFRVVGTTRDLRFDVDFTQVLGRFALHGRVQRPPGVPPLFETEGDVADFRIGTLIGRTGLFASPLTGRVRASGGGGQAYAFDLDLRGPDAALDVEGWYLPTAVPRYAASGVVGGLNLQLVPGLEASPPTHVSAAFSLDGEGTTLETVAGRLTLDATGSLVGGLPLQAAAARLEARDGILLVDTLDIGIVGSRVRAAGQWGLTRPAPQPLRFGLGSPNLAALTPVLRSLQLIEPQITGALGARGSVGGTVENPIIELSARGRNLRFDNWRAATLALELDVARAPTGWSGEASVVADNVLLQTESFEAIRVEAAGNVQAVALGLTARRDRLTEVELSGVVELVDEVPRGVALDALTMRLDRSVWELQQPTTIRWSDAAGLAVDSLMLVRSGPQQGFIEVDGSIPPSGTIDMHVRARSVDLAEFHRLVPAAPPIEGVLSLEASLLGSPAAPQLVLDSRVDGLAFGGARAEALVLDLRYADGAATLDAGLLELGQRVASATGTVPLRLTLAEMRPQLEPLDDQPVSVRVVADSVSTALVTALIPQVTDGAGVVMGEFTVGGVLGSPQLQGQARIARGAMTVPELNVRFEEINGQFDLVDQTIRVATLTARSVGAASLSGTILLDDRSRPLLNLSGSANQFRAINRADVATVAVTGSIALEGRYPTPTLTGRVELTNGNITLPSLEDRAAFEVGILDLADVVGEPLPTEVLEPTFVELIRISNLEVVVGDGVWAVSPEARVQIGGELLVSRFGPEDWQVFGDLLARRGSYTLTIGPLVREFDVASGRIEFFGTPDLNPALDIVALHRIRAGGVGGTGTLNILVNITGTAQFPRVTLTTDTQPPLPESEILSFLIFGRPTFALGEVGGALAQQLLVQEFAGGVIAGQIEQLIRQAGLPFAYVRVRGRPSPSEFAAAPLGTTTLEGGVEIAPNVFWTVEFGIAALFGREVGETWNTWGTSLEWEIDRQWSTRLAWEPLRRDLLLQRQFGTGLVRQFTFELRRRWEYGRDPTGAEVTELVGGETPASAPQPEQPAGEEPLSREAPAADSTRGAAPR